jgi:transcriptional regulator with XRE-family HTH domain
MSLGENFEKVLKEMNWGVTDLAEAANMSARTVRSIIKEGIEPKAGTLKKMIIALNVSADRILFDDEELTGSTDLQLLFREINKLNGDEREYIKKVIKGILNQIKASEIEKY